eukprot:1146999-Pelagomonas_calceolata.AAC.5
MVACRSMVQSCLQPSWVDRRLSILNGRGCLLTIRFGSRGGVDSALLLTTVDSYRKGLLAKTSFTCKGSGSFISKGEGVDSALWLRSRKKREESKEGGKLAFGAWIGPLKTFLTGGTSGTVRTGQ